MSRISSQRSVKIAPSVTPDVLLKEVGAFGRYQILYMCLMQLLSLFFGLRILFVMYAIMVPQLVCNDPYVSISYLKNMTPAADDSCAVLKYCKNYTVISAHGFHTFFDDWPDLMLAKCESGNWADPVLLMLTVKDLLAGVLNLPISVMSDVYGRRSAILTSITACASLLLGSTFSPSLPAFGGFLLPISALTALIGDSSVTLGNEATTERYRLTMSYSRNYCLPFITVALLAYFLRSWRSMLQVASGLGLPLLIGYYLSAESPRWLLAKGEFARAAASLNWIAKVNGKPVRYTEGDLREQMEPLNQQIAVQTKKRYFNSILGVKRIFTNKRTVKHIAFVAWCNVIVNGFAAGFVVNAGILSTSPYISAGLLGLFRFFIPLPIVYLDLYHSNFNRKAFLYVSIIAAMVPLSVSAGGSVAMEFIQPVPALSTAVSVGVLMSTAMSRGLLWYAVNQVNLEVFPTVTRNSALAFLVLLFYMGEALGNQIRLLTHIWPPLLYIVAWLSYAVALVLAVILVPETKGKPMSDV